MAKGTTSQERRTCFVIAPIGDDESATRKRSDKVLKHIIAPVVNARGYDAVRADQIAEPGLITSQVIQHVAEDPLVVADLTDRNPNVFYELALRHAIKKPLVQMIAKGERLPFDIAAMRTIEVDISDLDSVDAAKEQLDNQIKSVEADPANIDTPINFALDLQNLRQSENPEERSLADLVAAVADLRSSVVSVERRLHSPEELLPPEYLEFALRRQRLLSSDPELREVSRLLRDRVRRLASDDEGASSDELARLVSSVDHLLYLVDRPELR